MVEKNENKDILFPNSDGVYRHDVAANRADEKISGVIYGANQEVLSKAEREGQGVFLNELAGGNKQADRIPVQDARDGQGSLKGANAVTAGGAGMEAAADFGLGGGLTNANKKGRITGSDDHRDISKLNRKDQDFVANYERVRDLTVDQLGQKKT